MSLSQKKIYNLDNPEDVNELIDMVWNDNLSDIGDIGCGDDEGDEDDLIEVVPIKTVVRPGQDKINKRDE